MRIAVTPQEAILHLRRTINMGNTLEAPREGDWGFLIEAWHFDLLRRAGFTAVRIPIRWSAHAAPQDPYTIEATFRARIQEVSRWALERGLAVILNIHHYEEMATDPRGHEARFLALWQQIAACFQAAPDNLFLELLNEPNGACTTQLWSEIAARAVAVIRVSHPTRVLLLGGGNWNAHDQLPLLTLPQDSALIAVFHYYSPFQFTHQGAEWMPGSEAWLGTTWSATEAQRADVDAHFDAVLRWSQPLNLPVLLGEFGAYSRAPQPSRITWTRWIRQQAERRGFAWAYWEFGAGFGLYDRSAGRWRADLLAALLQD